MASSANYADPILDRWDGTSTAAALTGQHISLHTGDPGTTGASEVSTSGTAYARQPLTGASFGTKAGTPGTDYHIPYDAVITFAEATGAGFGLCTHLGVFTAVTAGTFQVGGSLDTSQSVPAGVTASFASGAAKIRQL